MTTPKHRKAESAEATPEREKGPEARAAAVAARLLQTLGTPADLRGVQVRGLWGDYFRANVFTGPAASEARIAHSFFLKVADDGSIVAASPQITRRYPAGPAGERGDSP